MFKKITKTTTFLWVLVFVGCVSPLSTNTPDQQTKASGAEGSAIVEIENKGDTKDLVVLPDTTKTTVEKSLSNRILELETLSPYSSKDGWNTKLGFDLNLDLAQTAPLSMQSAITLAIENNLDIQISSFQPKIAEQSVTAAQAAFDFVFGAGVSKTKNRVPQQQAITPAGQPLSSSERKSDIFSTNASLSKKLDSGGTFLLSTDVTKTETGSQEFDYSPDPAWQTIGTLELNQPLLRNFGEKISLSQIRISELDHDITVEEAKKTLNDVITASEQAYLDMCLQWRVLQINQWLLEQGENLVETLEHRMSYDTSEADYAQAVATVQRRRTDVIKQQSAVYAASDRLKQLINSENYSLESELVIQPTGEVKATPITVSLKQALVTAIANRPDLKALAIEISSSDINLEVAENAKLPQLDMQAQMSLYGLGDSAGRGYEEVFDRDYVNYLLGLTFSVPLGNREADSNAKIMRLKQMSAISSYKKGIQKATIEIKNTLRDILTNASLMRANKDYRIAQAENLRALLVEEETMAGLTPTFLNLKLQTQSGLAQAKISEVQSVVNYNKSISELYKAMGTSMSHHQVSFVDQEINEQ